MTTCQKALAIWSEKNDGAAPEEATEVALLAMIPPIQKLDANLNALVNVKKLSISTNAIDKMISLPGLKNLEILSLGRNQIKKIAGLEEVGATLKELWISYNHISTLDGLHPCVKLTTLFISNNKIKQWEELSKLTQNPELSNILLQGNPMYEGFTKKNAAPQVVKFLPNLRTIDGEMVTGIDSGDAVAQSVRDTLVEKYGSLDDALQNAGMDSGTMLSKPDFIKAMATLGVDAAEAEHVFDNTAENGMCSLDAMADFVENA